MWTFDTGMRQREILDLRWEQVNLRHGAIRLAPQDTKGEACPRMISAMRFAASRPDFLDTFWTHFAKVPPKAKSAAS